MATDLDVAFPTLSEQDIAALAARGHPRDVRAGEILFTAGDRSFCFYVVLQGSIEILNLGADGDAPVAVHRARQFSGDVDMLTGRAAVVTARVGEDGRVLQLSATELRHAVDELPDLGETIVKAFLMRRELLLRSGLAVVRIIGSRFSPDAHRLRDFATRNLIPVQVGGRRDRRAGRRHPPAVQHLAGGYAGRPGAERQVQEEPVAPGIRPVRRAHGGVCRTITSTTSWWWVPVRPAWPPRYTRPPKGSTCSPPTRWRPADRPAPARGSRTTSAFRPGSRERSSPGTRRFRPSASAPRSPCRARCARSACRAATGS